MFKVETMKDGQVTVEKFNSLEEAGKHAKKVFHSLVKGESVSVLYVDPKFKDDRLIEYRGV